MQEQKPKPADKLYEQYLMRQALRQYNDAARLIERRKGVRAE